MFLFSLEVVEQTRQTRNWRRNKIAIIHDNMIVCIKSSNRTDKQLETINSVWLLNTESTYENQLFLSVSSWTQIFVSFLNLILLLLLFLFLLYNIA